MKQWYLMATFLAAFVSNAMPLENEDKAYDGLHGQIVERIRLWPALAPHETEANPGRYAYDERVKVWRRRLRPLLPRTRISNFTPCGAAEIMV